MSVHPPPGDRDDFDPFSDNADETEVAKKEPQPWLRFCIGVVIVSLVSILLTTITANNSGPNSQAETVALNINRISRMTLLAAFVGVLIVMRLPQIQALMRSSARQQDNDPDSGEQESATDGASAGHVFQRHPSSSKSSSTNVRRILAPADRFTGRLCCGMDFGLLTPELMDAACGHNHQRRRCRVGRIDGYDRCCSSRASSSICNRCQFCVALQSNVGDGRDGC